MKLIASELDLPVAQVVALYNKAMRKFANYLLALQRRELEEQTAKQDEQVLRKAAAAEERAERGGQVRTFPSILSRNGDTLLVVCVCVCVCV